MTHYTRRKGGVTAPPLSDEDINAFHEAVRDVTPLPPSNRVSSPAPRPKPVPQQTRHDAQPAIADLLSDHIPWNETEDGDEVSFLRPGLPQQTLRRLRRGHWAIRDELDLHGMTSDEARQRLVAFLNDCQTRGLRCVRIIHGKGLGSRNREPVLKSRTRSWLMQRNEVLAFTEAKPEDGGGGAVLVLLKTSRASR